MKFSVKKLSRRSGLGILAIALISVSAFAMLALTQTITTFTITQADPLTTGCATLQPSSYVQPTIANSTADYYQYDFNCAPAAAISTQFFTNVIQTTGGVFTVATSASLKPTIGFAGVPLPAGVTLIGT